MVENNLYRIKIDDLKNNSCIVLAHNQSEALRIAFDHSDMPSELQNDILKQIHVDQIDTTKSKFLNGDSLWAKL